VQIPACERAKTTPFLPFLNPASAI
jgi:hypothetical protein